ncbi:MAG: hypothetical protein GYB31_11960 [Bacteroidetes bacterium]|nr:hypothetical protein [Bacteroidota bacterium]
MKSLVLQCFILLLPIIMKAQDHIVTSLEWEANQTQEVKGNLEEGAPMEDLSWAWDGANACFPGTQSHKFTGNHVLYIIPLPSYSQMEVRVIPEDKNANFSLYAYQTGTGPNPPIVPNLPSCVRCEVDHKWDYKRRGKTQDHTRTVTDLLATKNPYQVVIGVVGAEGLDSGAYTLQIKMIKLK